MYPFLFFAGTGYVISFPTNVIVVSVVFPVEPPVGLPVESPVEPPVLLPVPSTVTLATTSFWFVGEISDISAVPADFP